MSPHYRQTRFLQSAARVEQSPADRGYEVAFAGRSNAGKSSALNAACDQKALARTSKTPGRTQLLNFFSVDDQRRLVDLPGYGYAQVAEGIKQDWQRTLSAFLEQRQCLRGLILLMDIRHPMKPFDQQMLDWVRHYRVACHILLTKADKLSLTQARTVMAEVGAQLGTGADAPTLQLFSATRKWGIDELHQVLDAWLRWPAAE
jgi:GTP-binding protein